MGRVGRGAFLSKLILGGALSFALAACAVLAGLGTDYATAEGGADGEADHGSADAGEGGDVLLHADAAGPGDAVAADAVDAGACVPGMPDSGSLCTSTEDCTDGVDNDCDCLVDCEDPQCAPGFTCTAGPVDTGWTVIAFDPKSAFAMCPSGYNPGTLTQIYDLTLPGTCSCQCGGQAGCGGTAGLTAGTSPSCSTNGWYASLDVNAGLCGQGSIPLDSSHYFDLAAGTTTVVNGCASMGICTPTPATLNSGATCSYSGALGKGCAVGACAPRPGAEGLCIEQSGTASCPAGFTKQIFVSTSNGVQGILTCGVCGCGPQLTCGAITSVSLYADTACASLLRTVPPCLIGPPTSAASYRVSYLSNGLTGCVPTSSPTPMGSLTLSGPITTVCCP